MLNLILCNDCLYLISSFSNLNKCDARFTWTPEFEFPRRVGWPRFVSFIYDSNQTNL